MKCLMAVAAVALGATMGLGGGASQAAPVTFDGGVLETFVGLHSATYTEGGLRFDFYGERPHFVDDGNGGHALSIDLNNDILIAPVAGGHFSLTSFRFLGGGDTLFKGIDGSTQVAASYLCCLGNTKQLLADDPDWGHITVADWCGYCISGFNPGNSIDDLVFDLPPAPPTNAVPEPASWALMILGFGGMGAAMRSRRRAALVGA